MLRRTKCRFAMTAAWLSLGIALTAALAVAFISGCDFFGEEELPFPWARKGTRLVYDFVPVADSAYFGNYPDPAPPPTGRAFSFLFVDVPVNGDSSLIIFRSVASDFPDDYLWFNPKQFVPKQIVRRRDGLHLWNLCASRDDPERWPRTWLRVPARPRLGQAFWQIEREKVCSEPFYYQWFYVTAVNKAITVPVGTFKTFRIRAYIHDQAGRGFENPSGIFVHEYWSEPYGLIRIEIFDDRDVHVGTFDLTEMSINCTDQELKNYMEPCGERVL